MGGTSISEHVADHGTHGVARCTGFGSSPGVCCRAPTVLAVAIMNALKTEPLAKERGIAWPFFEVGIA